MKAIILAAGEGIRMRPLTEHIPKQLIHVRGKPLINHLVGVLPSAVDELIVVVGYRGEKICDHCKDRFLGMPVTYLWQEEKTGTYSAMDLARSYIKEGERFFVLCGDDLHGKEGLEECLHYPRAILVDEVEDPRAYGVVETDEEGYISDIVEKPDFPKSNLVNTGVWMLDSNIFKYAPDRHNNGEYFITSAIQKMIRCHPVKAVRSSFWWPMTTPADIERYEKSLLSTI
ncbi:MAG TPA: nucleotidyltransferase family protein [Candidatus Paceibacterota bacterium]